MSIILFLSLYFLVSSSLALPHGDLNATAHAASSSAPRPIYTPQQQSSSLIGVSPWDNTWSSNNYYRAHSNNNQEGINHGGNSVVNFKEEQELLAESESALGAHHSHYDTSGLQQQVGATGVGGGGGQNYNYYYPQQGYEQPSTFHYQIYPAKAQVNGAQGYYGGNNGWGQNNGNNKGLLNGINLGHIEHFFQNLNFDQILSGPLLGVLGIKGVKGAVALIKIGFFFLFVAVPLLLFITVPLSVLLTILVLAIPIPTWGQIRGVRSLSDSTSKLIEKVILVDECIERFSCELGHFSKKHGKDSWVKSVNSQIKAYTWGKRISRGLETEDDAPCRKFTCRPLNKFHQFNILTTNNRGPSLKLKMGK